MATPGIALLVLVGVGVNEWTHQRNQAVREERTALFQARTAGMQALQLLTDAETAQRGFLPTGRTESLEPYQAAVTALPRYLESTIRFLRGAGEQAAERAAEAQLLIDRRLQELTRTVELNRQGRRDEAIAFIVAGQGKQAMDRLRQKLNGALDAAAARDKVLADAVHAELSLRR